MEPDFSGWATKAGLECSDGRTIMPGAFAHQDGKKVPLVWAHSHDTATSVLGHAILEKRDEGVYAYCFLNETEAGQHVKVAVQHGDIDSLSIYANKLRESNGQVRHGFIKELSVVLSGANPEALIDQIAHGGMIIEQAAFAHGDTVFEPEGEVIIYNNLPIEHEDMSDGSAVEHAEGDDDGEETVEDVYNSMSPKQKQVVNFMVGAALEQSAAGTASHSDLDENAEDTESDADETDDEGDQTDDEQSEDSSTEGTESEGDQQTDTNAEGDLAHQEGNSTMTNVFDKSMTADAIDTKHRLTHDQLVTIVAEGKRLNSFKDAVLAHAEEYGITDIDLLFPEARALTNTPQFISRRMEWVAKVLDNVKKSPFAKVKTLLADITEPEARAKGYIKGTRKKEEVFGLLKRTTGPTTIYKKQKLDRDDMVDITDIDVVAWLKAEMRLMIEEELARAILVGDGRSAMDEDKVKDPAGALDGLGIRSIYHDDDLYAIKRTMPSNVEPKDVVKTVVRASNDYRGTGAPTMFVSRANLTELLLQEDKFGRSLYADKAALADKLGVSDIVPVDIFAEYDGLYAIIVSLADYTIGSNRGGELTSFEDFDIDFNQHKYLQETRLSGGLTKPFSAIVIRRELGTAATATAPSFDGETNTVTIPTVTGVTYYNADTDEDLTGDVVITEPTEVRARANDGFYLPAGSTTSWSYTP